MKANELRLGNWWDNKEGRQYIIDNETMMNFMNEALENNGEVSINPVPLSEQWFNDFGFEKFAEFKIYNKQGKLWHYSIQKDPNDKDGYIFFIDIEDVAAPPSVKIKYVHTLQNLYFAFEQTELERNEN